MHILDDEPSTPAGVILREPERSDRRPKDRFPSRQFNCLGWRAIPRRFAPQDDSRGRVTAVRLN